MSDLIRLSLLSDYRARLVAMFPRVTAAQLMRFDDLVATDRLVTDDGAPHRALEDWLHAVIGDAPPEAVLAGLPPAPKPVPGSKAMEAVRS
jgi:hypothetical protein